MNGDERIAQMVRTYRVTIDIDVYSASCDIKSIRIVKTENVKNVICSPPGEYP